MDEAILRALNAWNLTPAVTPSAIFFSSPWMLLATTLPLFIILVYRKRWIAILSIALAMGSADLVNTRIVKPTFERVRPCRALQELHLPLKCGPGQSFASGHASVAFAFAVSASPVLRFGWIVFPLAAFLVAASRVVLGAHYPTDVIAGALLGSILGGICWALRRHFEKKRELRTPNPHPHDPPTTSEPASPPP